MQNSGADQHQFILHEGLGANTTARAGLGGQCDCSQAKLTISPVLPLCNENWTGDAAEKGSVDAGERIAQSWLIRRGEFA